MGPFATIAHLARLPRVTHLISAIPDLPLIVATMLRSIPSMGHVILWLGLLLYVYLQHAVLSARPFAWLLFGCFIVVAVLVVLNLFIAVVLDNLERFEQRVRGGA